MGADLLDLALLHHDDFVRVDNSAKSVRDHNDSEALLLKEGVQGSLNLVLTLCIKS